MALALCLVFGGILLGISLMGFFLMPLPKEVQLVYPLSDENADRLEYAFRSYSFFLQTGLIRGEFVVAGDALSPETRRMLSRLEKQYPRMFRKE